MLIDPIHHSPAEAAQILRDGDHGQVKAEVRRLLRGTSHDRARLHWNALFVTALRERELSVLVFGDR